MIDRWRDLAAILKEFVAMPHGDGKCENKIVMFAGASIEGQMTTILRELAEAETLVRELQRPR